MARYSIEPRTRKYAKRCRFFSFARKIAKKYGKKLIGYWYKNRTRFSKNCFQKSSS